jgi:hypothetical protein
MSIKSFLRTLKWLKTDSFRGQSAIGSALAGGIIAYLSIFYLSGKGRASADISFFVQFGVLGGAIGGAIFSGWFGRSGYAGFLLTIVATLMCAVTAGGLAGTLFFPGFGTIFGAVFAPTVIFNRWQPFLAWVCYVCLMHCWIRYLRRT